MDFSLRGHSLQIGIVVVSKAAPTQARKANPVDLNRLVSLALYPLPYCPCLSPFPSFETSSLYLRTADAPDPPVPQRGFVNRSTPVVTGRP